MDPNLLDKGAEIRAAVGLLSRSIRIVSGGGGPGVPFPAATPGAYFGAHMVIRQGFKDVQIQGVQFEDMGQGGKMGHYPIHFHMARQVPTDTYIKDSTVDESQTRWIVLHSTDGVLLQRNIGWKSIGHGFFLENGTEAYNRFYSNLGIFARAAVMNAQNPRQVPGILAYTKDNTYLPDPADGGKINLLPADAFPERTDFQHPTVFWITNGWNDFVGNMAAGANACGAAYWFVPAWNSDMAEVPTNAVNGHMNWSNLGYAGEQSSLANAASTPLKRFYGNFASSTMTSFQTVAITTQCFGADWPGDAAAKDGGHFPASRASRPSRNRLPRRTVTCTTRISAAVDARRRSATPPATRTTARKSPAARSPSAAMAWTPMDLMGMTETP